MSSRCDYFPSAARGHQNLVTSHVRVILASSMADQGEQASAPSVKRKSKQLGKYCVAGGPNNESCKNNSSTPGISMHEFPKERSPLQKSWVQFVQRHRRGWQPSPYSCLCSAHFLPNCYHQTLDMGEGTKTKRLLDRSSAVPTIDTVSAEPIAAQVSTRERRLVSHCDCQ